MAIGSFKLLGIDAAYVVFAIVCLLPLAHGDEPIAPITPDAANTASAETLQSVDVVGHYDNGVGTSNAASQGVIMGSLLQDIPLLRPGEVLEAVPGLVVTQHSGEGKANQYFLRGYNLDHGTDFATSVDGVPVNMPTNGHGQGYTDLNFLIPELVQKIDYRKGPYFAQNGDFSSAGSADISYRNSLDAPLLNITVGDNAYQRVLAAASFPLSTQGPVLLTAIEAMHENGPFANPDDMQKVNGVLRLSDGTAERGWSIDGLLYDAHWNSTDQVPLELIESGTLCLYCALDPTDGGRSARQILSGEWHSHDADGYVKAAGYVEHYRLQLWSNFTYFENDPERGDQFNQRDSRDIEGVSVVKGWSHGLFGLPSTTEVGVQIRHDDIHVSLFDTEARVPFATVSDNLVDEAQGALYAQNSTVWNDWFRTLLGIREDAIRLDLTSQTYRPNSGTDSDSRISPKASFIFGPWSKTEFFANIGNGFHSNDARGVIYRFDPTTGNSVDRAPALVGSFGKEIGVRTEAIPGLQTSLALWNLNSASELVYSADSGGTEINGASKRYGAELNNHYVLNDWLFLDADFARTHARFANKNDNDESGDQIPNAVGKVASVSVAVHDIGLWSGDIKLRYIGPYPLSQDGTLRAPSAIVTNVRVQREVTSWASLSLDVLNIFDRRYNDIAYEQDYRVCPTCDLVPDGITVHPGESREFRLTLRMRL